MPFFFFLLKCGLSFTLKIGTEVHKNPACLFLFYMFIVVQRFWTKKEGPGGYCAGYYVNRE